MAATDQVLTPEKARKLFDDAGRLVDSIDVPLNVTPAILKSSTVSRYTPGSKRRRNARRRIGLSINRGWPAYFVTLLRDAAEVILRQDPT